jgi:uncharacterized Rmd1/YagE family protein
MEIPRFSAERRMKVRALLLGNRLELRGLEKTNILAPSPLVLSAGEKGVAVLFRYGAAVLFGLTPDEEQSFLTELAPYLRDPYPTPETEETVLAQAGETPEGIFGSEIRIKDLCVENIQILADVLAKSVVLGYYETSLAATFNTIEPLAENLQRTGSPGARPKELLKQLGETLLVETRMVGRVEIADKPELLWENPQHDRLHKLLADEYELKERHAILEQKITLISRTAEKVLGLLQHRSTIRVEWYITALIVLEILITLYTMFFR